MKSLFCRLGRHKRSRSRAWRDAGGVARSECRGCGAAMIRDDAAGTWRIAEAAGVPSAT